MSFRPNISYKLRPHLYCKSSFLDFKRIRGDPSSADLHTAIIERNECVLVNKISLKTTTLWEALKEKAVISSQEVDYILVRLPF